MNLIDVHDDILSEIFSFLHYKDILSTTLVCKKWRESINSLYNTFDQKLIKEFYPTLGIFKFLSL